MPADSRPQPPVKPGSNRRPLHQASRFFKNAPAPTIPAPKVCSKPPAGPPASASSSPNHSGA